MRDSIRTRNTKQWPTQRRSQLRRRSAPHPLGLYLQCSLHIASRLRVSQRAHSLSPRVGYPTHAGYGEKKCRKKFILYVYCSGARAVDAVRMLLWCMYGMAAQHDCILPRILSVDAATRRMWVLKETRTLSRSLPASPVVTL